MFLANSVSTAIDFKTITIAQSVSALVVTLVLLLYLFAALFYKQKQTLNEAIGSPMLGNKSLEL